jgi:imidazolonepropionase-like amidohydrolase
MNATRNNSPMKTIHKILSLAVVASAMIVVAPSQSAAQSVAYTDAIIETMGKEGRIENATMVVSDGKITNIGSEVEIPGDARVVSLAGKTIMPGIIDPYFVFKRTSVSNTRTVTFRGRTFTIPGGGPFNAGPFTRVGEYFDPFNFNFNPAKRTGITTVNLVSDGRGLSAFANLTEETDAEMLFESNGRIFAKVTNQTSAFDVIRKPLEPPKKTSKKKSASSSSSESDEKKKLTPAEELKKTWESIRKGDTPLFVNVNNEAAVAYLLQFAEKQEKLKLVLVATGPNLYQSLDKIQKNKNITIVLQPGIDTVPFSADLMNVSQLLAEREIPFCISMSLSQSQMSASQDDPMFPVAMLVKTGLDRDLALKNITMKPAEILGIEKTHGSLEKEKHANFLVFDGDPLKTGSRLQQVFLNGKKIHEN